jgi:hypothetical protein
MVGPSYWLCIVIIAWVGVCRCCSRCSSDEGQAVMFYQVKRSRQYAAEYKISD